MKTIFESITKRLTSIQGLNTIWKLGSYIVGRYNSSRIALLAAGLTYYAAFSLGPILLLLAAGLAFFLKQNPVLTNQYRTEISRAVAQFLPFNENIALITEQSFDNIVALLQQGALIQSLISIGILLWVGSSFFTSLQLALELIFQSSVARGYWRKRFVGVLLILAVFIIIAIEVIGVSLINSGLQLIVNMQTFVGNALGENVSFISPYSFKLDYYFNELYRVIISIAALTLCFRFLPKTCNWAGAFVGALFCTTAAAFTQRLLPIFFSVERFNLIYGLINSLMLILFWLYISIMLFLVGALIAAEISHYSRDELDKLLDSDDSEEAKIVF